MRSPRSKQCLKKLVSAQTLSPRHCERNRVWHQHLMQKVLEHSDCYTRADCRLRMSDLKARPSRNDFADLSKNYLNPSRTPAGLSKMMDSA
jgi:hypothetical protein